MEKVNLIGTHIVMTRDEYYAALNNSKEELRHHGILGQKWGVRRYQNKDGTLTKAGREHIRKTTDPENRVSIFSRKENEKNRVSVMVDPNRHASLDNHKKQQYEDYKKSGYSIPDEYEHSREFFDVVVRDTSDDHKYIKEDLDRFIDNFAEATLKDLNLETSSESKEYAKQTVRDMFDNDPYFMDFKYEKNYRDDISFYSNKTYSTEEKKANSRELNSIIEKSASSRSTGRASASEVWEKSETMKKFAENTKNDYEIRNLIYDGKIPVPKDVVDKADGVYNDRELRYYGYGDKFKDIMKARASALVYDKKDVDTIMELVEMADWDEINDTYHDKAWLYWH